MSPISVLLSAAAFACHAAAITAIPSQSTSSYSAGPAASIAPTSYSFTYTVTTPTTVWAAPTFATAASAPACSAVTCPAQDKSSCTDSMGGIYNILCATRFSGVVITNSGRKYLLERDEDLERIAIEEAYAGKKKRDYTGTFDNCVTYCDSFDKTSCYGVAFQSGYCMAYDTITGTFPSSGFVALRK